DGGETDDLERSTYGAGLLEQGFRFLGVVLQAAALQVPKVATWVGLVKHVALAVKYRMVDSIAVDGMGCGGAQLLILKWPATEVEGHKDAAEMRLPEVVFVAIHLLEAFYISIAYGIDQMHLAGAQGSQADRVLLLGFANDLIEVGQIVALGISLPVVFK